MKKLGISANLRCALIVCARLRGAALADTAAQAQGGAYLGPSAAVVSGDGRRLFVCLSDARQLAVVDLPGGSVIRKVPARRSRRDWRLSPDGRRVYVACARRGQLGAGDRHGLRQESSPACPPATATAPAFSPDGKRLYVCNPLTMMCR